MIHAIYEELSRSQSPRRCFLLESLKRSQKGQDQTWLKFWWVEHHKKLQDAAIWTLPISKGYKGQIKVNIELVHDFDVENNSIKLRNDTGNSCRVIVFTRQFDLELAKVQKGHTKVNIKLVWDFYVENIRYKVRTWYRQSTKSYRVHKVLDAAC